MNENADDSAEKPDELAEHRARMRHDWSNLIEDLIEEGRKQGIFDDLPGKGKPLKLEGNPYSRETELAHNLLKHNDLRPAWITNRNGLLEEIKALRNEIKHVWKRHEREHRYVQAEAQQRALARSWDEACRNWEARIANLNKQIDSFNLKRPSTNLEMFKLTLEKELERAQARRRLE